MQDATVRIINQSVCGGASEAALSFSFGLILTPSSFGFGLLGFEVAVDEVGGGDVKGDEANFRSEGGGVSLTAGATLDLAVRCRLGLACESKGDAWGLGGSEG